MNPIQFLNRWVYTSAAGGWNVRQIDAGLVVILVFGCSAFVVVDILQLLLEILHQLGFRSKCLYTRILPGELFSNGQDAFRAFIQRCILSIRFVHSSSVGIGRLAEKANNFEIDLTVSERVLQLAILVRQQTRLTFSLTRITKHPL
jgi:hypothetical protein